MLRLAPRFHSYNTKNICFSFNPAMRRVCFILKQKTIKTMLKCGSPFEVLQEV